MPTRSIRSAEAAGAVAARRTGRVCGAGAGKAPRPTAIRTRHDLASPTTASVKDRQWKSGSGPTRNKMSLPSLSWPWRIWVRGHVSFGRDPVDDAGHRAPGPLVQEVLAVEGHHGAGQPLGHQRGDGRRGPESGVDPAFERDDEHRVGRGSARRGLRKFPSSDRGSRSGSRFQGLGRHFGQAGHLGRERVHASLVAGSGAGHVAGVDTLQDAGQLPVAEGGVVAEP